MNCPSGILLRGVSFLLQEPDQKGSTAITIESTTTHDKTRSTQLEIGRRSGLANKAAALLEVLGVFIVGNFTAGYVGKLIGVRPLGPVLVSTIRSADPDFVPLTIAFLQTILVQYICLLPPAFAIGWWRRRLKPRHYGVTRAGKSGLELVGLGLLAVALVGMPIKLLWVAKRFIPLGEGSPIWMLLDKSWTPSFWLFFAVASFTLVPVLEELFYRGYCQTRLEEEFGGAGAIVIVTLFMTLGHSQYHHLSVLSIGTIFGMIPLILGMGYVYWRTRSLIPAIILHAMVNVPTKGIYDFLLPAAMLVVLILFGRKWVSMVQDFWRLMSGKEWKRAALLGSVLAIGAVLGFESWPEVFVPLGFLGLVVALVTLFLGGRTNPLPNDKSA
jgi:membrane protease YdiL (CAAX protease family)